jgi:Ion channel
MVTLDKFVRYLSRVHPIHYLAAYLIAIPLFGILYTYISPHGFYAPYARYEPSAAGDLEHLKHLLEDQIKRIIHYSDDMQVIIDDEPLFLNSMRIDDLHSVDGTSILFRIIFPYASRSRPADNGDRTIILPSISQYVQVNKLPFLHLQDSFGEYIFREIHFVSTPRDTQWIYDKYNNFDEKVFSRLFSAPESCALQTTCPLIFTRINDEHVIIDYLDGVQGDPFAISGLFPRMIYLSAVVITTLGLGDIVPITPLSRFLVAAEAVLGITFAGLFLNALAFSASNARV